MSACDVHAPAKKAPNLRTRALFAGALTALSATKLANFPSRAAFVPEEAVLIDTNVSLSSWLTRNSWAESPAQLVAKLRRYGIASAWTGAFDAVLHTDIGQVNQRLTETCARFGEGVLVPFGTVNPAMPDWEEDLRRCHEVHRMPGLRLFPGYHGYRLDDPSLVRLVDQASRRQLLVQIVLSVEDNRSESPAFEAKPVQAALLAEIMERLPHSRLMLLNAFSRVLAGNQLLLRRFVAAGALFEIATLEGVAGIEMILRSLPNIRLTFGSNAPYYYFESAYLKLWESKLLPLQLAALRSGNARAALSR